MAYQRWDQLQQKRSREKVSECANQLDGIGLHDGTSIDRGVIQLGEDVRVEYLEDVDVRVDGGCASSLEDRRAAPDGDCQHEIQGRADGVLNASPLLSVVLDHRQLSV